MILTIAEIRELAQFAGLVLTESSVADTDCDETEIAVEDCPDGGLIDPDDNLVCRYAHVAYFVDYPEEGSCGLGPKLLNSPADLTAVAGNIQRDVRCPLVFECHNSKCIHAGTHTHRPDCDVPCPLVSCESSCLDAEPNASLELVERSDDTLQDLVRRSQEEDLENARKAQHNAKSATEDMLPYQNDAVCDLIEAVDRLLSPNSTLNSPV